MAEETKREPNRKLRSIPCGPAEAGGILNSQRAESQTNDQRHSGALAQYDSWRTLVGLYALYLLATVVLTWPVIAHPGYKIPGWPGDCQIYV